MMPAPEVLKPGLADSLANMPGVQHYDQLMMIEIYSIIIAGHKGEILFSHAPIVERMDNSIQQNCL